MTANEVYTAALAVVSQLPGENERWDKLAVSWINIALSEAFKAENHMRFLGGNPQLMTAPRIDSLEDDTCFDERLFAILVESVASFLWTDQDEGYKAQDCRNRAQANMDELLMMSRPESVVDVYGD